MNDGMKALSLWQPWASLVACKAKRIETRSWGTAHRGWLAIHASRGTFNGTARELASTPPGLGPLADSAFEPEWLDGKLQCSGAIMPIFEAELFRAIPFGAVVAVVELVDCLVIPEPPDVGSCSTLQLQAFKESELGGRFRDLSRQGHDLESEITFGNFTAGRYAWIFGDVKPVVPPVEIRGRQRLFEIPYRLHEGRFALVEAKS